MEQSPVLSLCPSFNSYSKLTFEINGDDGVIISKDESFAVDHLDPTSLDPPPPSDPLDDSDDSDFTFACRDASGSPISADEIFSNGQIRTVYPVFNRDVLLYSDSSAAAAADNQQEKCAGEQSRRLPLRQLMIEDRDPFSSSSSESDELDGILPETYCVWKPRPSAAATPKSNSTGSSKRWRFRDLLRRSSSDGKETFVFLEKDGKSHSRDGNVAGKWKEKEKDPAAAKERDRRRMYLPYKKEVMEFFSNG
ncbi:hypothetical protein MRB53_031519 [Persea americana]|uniref:Uncharacterized protein n=1 Tax=Persea americana TaxID=3435 RepID=A0ACC2KPN1_PERAE|nr:hypothetical protein MRB53_031519 [Persea americana]